MGRPVQRVGDPNTGGGIGYGNGHNNVLINFRPAMIPLTPYSTHIGCSPYTPLHCAGVVAVSGVATTVFANGIPLVLDGAVDICGHTRTLGSFDVLAV